MLLQKAGGDFFRDLAFHRLPHDLRFVLAQRDDDDEAVPLGNGLMGGLLWGGGSTLRLSLDRGDLHIARGDLPEPAPAAPIVAARAVVRLPGARGR